MRYSNKTVTYSNKTVKLQSVTLMQQSLVQTHKLIFGVYFRNVTGFVKRGLPHTSNSITLEDRNMVFERHTKLKLSPNSDLCWLFPLIKFQVNSFNQSEVMNCQNWWVGCVWKTLFRKSVHKIILLVKKF